MMRKQSSKVLSKSGRLQILLGLYGVVGFFILLVPFQLLAISQWNLYHQGTEASFAGIRWFQYLGGILIFIVQLLIPYIPGRFALARTKDLANLVLFSLISIPSYLFGPPNNLSWTNWEYNGAQIVLLFLFGGLITLVDIVYSNPSIPPALDKPFTNDPDIRRARWELIREEQERWWKGLQTFLVVIIALMISIGVAWANSAIPKQATDAGRAAQFISYRMSQIAWVEGVAFIGVLVIVINIFARINLMHRELESEYLQLVKQVNDEATPKPPGKLPRSN